MFEGKELQEKAAGDFPVWQGEGWESILGTDRHGWSKGYVFLDDGTYLQDFDIAAYLSRRTVSESLVATMSGCFAAVFETREGELCLVNDRFGSIPIYFSTNEPIAVSADPWSLVALLGAQANDFIGIFDLINAGYVTGDRTIFAGLSVLPPATIATINAGKLRSKQYWHYTYRPEEISDATAVDLLESVLREVGLRVSNYIDSNDLTAAITLSGGLDSRVLAALLSGDRRVSAVTYGCFGDPEALAATEVATALELDFTASVITPRDFFTSMEEATVDVGVTTRFTCGFGIRTARLPQLDVLIPGHTGDLVTGGHLKSSSALVSGPNQLIRYLEFKHFDFPGSRKLCRNIFGSLYGDLRRRSLQETTKNFDFQEDIFGLIDRWNVENRQRKLILMELRAYERKANWLLPFYDYKLVDFLAKIPHRMRFGQNLYIRTAVDRLFNGKMAALGKIARVGGSFHSTGHRKEAIINVVRTLQPFSGLLTPALSPSRALIRKADTIRRSGPDPLKSWYIEDSSFRAETEERLEQANLGFIDTGKLVDALRSETAANDVYDRVLPAVLTVGEALKRAQQIRSNEHAVR